MGEFDIHAGMQDRDFVGLTEAMRAGDAAMRMPSM